MTHLGGTGCWWGLNALRRGSRSVSSAFAAGTVQTMALSTQSLEMKEAARALGADGVVGIDFDCEVLGETNGMMMVTVSGTAVKRA